MLEFLNKLASPMNAQVLNEDGPIHILSPSRFLKTCFEGHFNQFMNRQSMSGLLTHICLVDPSIVINWMSPFPILGCLVYFFIFILFP